MIRAEVLGQQYRFLCFFFVLPGTSGGQLSPSRRRGLDPSAGDKTDVGRRGAARSELA